MAVTNTGIVERVITGVHDANFVRPLTDNFIDPNNWTISDWTLSGEAFVGDASILESTQEIFDTILFRDLIISFKVDASSGQVAVYMDGQPKNWISESGEYEYEVTASTKTIEIDGRNSFPFTGSVYDISVKQLIVTRESTATNTGAVERNITGVHDANFVRPLGDEEVLNGDFSNGSTGWQNFNSNASIVDEKLECNNVVENVNIVAQINAVPTQKYVKLQYDVIVNSGSFRILLGSSGTSTQITTSGRYAFYETSGTGGTLTLQARGGGFDGSVDNVSVKEILVTRESTATNTGIVERGVTGFNESVAFRQDTRTNLIPYSEDFSDASWVKTDTTIASNFAISPSGQLDADKLTFNTTNTQARAQHNLGGLITGNSYTQSYYIKSLGSDITLRIGTSGSVVGEFTDIIATSEWQRFEFSGIASGTAEYPRVQNITGTSGAQILVWGAQVEEQSHSTSYIPTSGAAVTVDNNSTSVVNNTGIVERPITGVNESDEMFPDNGTSSVVNIAEVIIPLLDSLEARATTFENREATQEILINLQKC